MKTTLSNRFARGLSKALLKDFDPSQPRDESGKWMGEGSHGAARDSMADFANVQRVFDDINRGNPQPSKADITQIKKYTAHDFKKTPAYERINGALRRDSPLKAEDQKVVDALDRVIQANPSQTDAVLYRAIAREADQPPLPEMKPGDTFSDKGFVSTSTNWTTGSDFQQSGKAEHRMLQIKVPKGTPALAVGKHIKDGPTENEVILPRGSKFKVSEVKEVDLPHRGKRTLYVLEMGASSPEGAPK
jgi:hypothetical protein